jgi:hypothetical protein
MTSENTNYPTQSIQVIKFPADFGSLFPRPAGLLDSVWPPRQVLYLGLYLGNLGCKTIIKESHYIDRDYILDLSAFYARSLRNYPNFCSRFHFLSNELEAEKWNLLFDPAVSRAQRDAVVQEIQKNYLGFAVVKPLPGSPVGRTILRTYPTVSASGSKRSFGGLRKYTCHLAGHQFHVEGLAFQQQDQGVSACATTALWSSLHKVAHDERVLVPAPAQITEAASRYLLADGRSLPSEGLNLQQISEAIRGSGLQPLVVKSVSLEEDRAQLLAYVASGFPPVLALQATSGGLGHAVCCVGAKLGDVTGLVSPATHPNYAVLADALEAIYVHDDRLGPYASAELTPLTGQVAGKSHISTGLQIQWPDKTQADISVVKAFIVPVPDKIRMPISRVIASGAVMAELAGMFFKGIERRVILNALYKLGVNYRQEALEFGLSKEGLRRFCCESVLPRFLGVIEISAKEGHLFDVLLDTTETRPNPSALFFIKRAALPPEHNLSLKALAEHFGAVYLS